MDSQKFVDIFLISVVLGASIIVAFPVNESEAMTQTKSRDPRQMNIQQRQDGTIVGSFSMANAMGAPGFDNSFAASQTFEIGPRGSSSAFSSAVDSNIAGNHMSFANSNAQNSRQGLFGGGMSAANAAASSFSNPMFSESNAQANSFGNQFGVGMPGFGK